MQVWLEFNTNYRNRLVFMILYNISLKSRRREIHCKKKKKKKKKEEEEKEMKWKLSCIREKNQRELDSFFLHTLI